jgi:hypothetical protein
MIPAWLTCRLVDLWWCEVSANLLYGFERFILQSVQSGHVKMTFSKERQRESRLFFYSVCATGTVASSAHGGWRAF